MSDRCPLGRRRRGQPASPLLAATLLAVWFVSGCASPGLSSRYRALNESWVSSETPAERAPTDDPLEGWPQLSRARLVQSVLDRNPSLRAARYAWRAALARYPQETSLDDPLLGYGVAPRSFGSREVDDAHKVDLSQKLPFPGKLSLRGEIALAEADAAARDFDAVRLRLATMASLLYDELYLLERSVEINAEHTELLDDFLRIATVRYEAGKAPLQAPLQAEVERAHLLHRDVVLKTALRVTSEQINLLLRRRPGLPLPPSPRLLELPAWAPPARATLVERALQNRPEIQAARARLQGRESGVALAQLEFLPDLTLVASYNSLWQRTDLQPFVGVRVNVPLRLSRRRAALEEARARVERAESERAMVEDEIRFSVETAMERFEESSHVLQLYESRLLPAARDHVDAARTGFETGRNSFLALIESERDLRGVRLGHEQARTDLSRRFAEFQRAVGDLPGSH